MYKLNKKGFTLVELLAVIVVLAVVILIASSSVGSAMIRARKGALAIEANEAINSAKSAYQLEVLDGTIQSGGACFSIEFLNKEGYFSKGANEKYKGSVLVSPSADGRTFDYKVWLTNGSFTILGKDATGANKGADVGVTGTGAESGDTAVENCNNAAGVKNFSWGASGRVVS